MLLTNLPYCIWGFNCQAGAGSGILERKKKKPSALTGIKNDQTNDIGSWAEERVSGGSVPDLIDASLRLDSLGTMDTNSTPLSSSSPFPSIQTEVVTVPPTIFPHVGYSILSFLMFINTVLSVFNNSVVIAVKLRNSALLQPMNVLILSLAVSDLMIGLCGSLVVTITNYQGSYFIGHTACVLQGFSVNYFGKFSCYMRCFCMCVFLEFRLSVCLTAFGP